MNTETVQKTVEIDLNAKDTREINFRQLKKLSNFMRREGLRVLEVGGVRMEKFGGEMISTTPSAPSADTSSHAKGNTLHDITSPLIGIFYAAPAPDAPPYVTVGQRIRRGDVLCVIEAMKIMNEITAETDGEIVEVCLNSNEIVEFGQVMFRVK